MPYEQASAAVEAAASRIVSHALNEHVHAQRSAQPPSGSVAQPADRLFSGRAVSVSLQSDDGQGGSEDEGGVGVGRPPLAARASLATPPPAAALPARPPGSVFYSSIAARGLAPRPGPTAPAPAPTWQPQQGAGGGLGGGRWLVSTPQVTCLPGCVNLVMRLQVGREVRAKQNKAKQSKTAALPCLPQGLRSAHELSAPPMRSTCPPRMHPATAGGTAAGRRWWQACRKHTRNCCNSCGHRRRGTASQRLPRCRASGPPGTARPPARRLPASHAPRSVSPGSCSSPRRCWSACGRPS
jgi:hypothetical protein